MPVFECVAVDEMPAEIDSHYLRTRPTRLWSRILSYALYEGRPLTTRGRWINPVVFANHALARRLPKLKTVQSPIFIIGTGRSGTTALGVVLSMHRDIGYLNEPKSIWHAVHGGEDLIGSYSRDEARYRLDANEIQPAHIKAMHRIYGAYLRVTGTKRVVDKYPELIFRVPFVKALFPDAKFLFLARNGWDTIHSITSWSDRLGVEKKGEAHDWWGADDRKWKLLVSQIVPEHPDLKPHQADMLGWQNHVDRAALEWIVSMREGLARMADHPDDILHIPFEALCETPQTWMERICSFTSLRSDPVFVRYAGEKLSPVKRRDPAEIHPILRAAFAETMDRLGYGDEAQPL